MCRGQQCQRTGGLRSRQPYGRWHSRRGGQQPGRAYYRYVACHQGVAAAGDAFAYDAILLNIYSAHRSMFTHVKPLLANWILCRGVGFRCDLHLGMFQMSLTSRAFTATFGAELVMHPLDGPSINLSAENFQPSSLPVSCECLGRHI